MTTTVDTDIVEKECMTPSWLWVQSHWFSVLLGLPLVCAPQYAVAWWNLVHALYTVAWLCTNRWDWQTPPSSRLSGINQLPLVCARISPSKARHPVVNLNCTLIDQVSKKCYKSWFGSLTKSKAPWNSFSFVKGEGHSMHEKLLVTHCFYFGSLVRRCT